MGCFEARKATSRRLVLPATPQDTKMNQQEVNLKLSSRLVTSSDTREADISSRLVCRKVQQHNTLHESHTVDAAYRSSTYRKPATVCLNISTHSLVVVIVSALLSMLLLLSAISAEHARVAVATTDSHLLESVRKISNSSEHQLSFFSSHYQSQNQPQYPLIYDSRQEAQQAKEVNRRRTLERQENPALVKQQNDHHQDQQKANKNSDYQHQYQKEEILGKNSGRRMKRSTSWSKNRQPSNSLESAGTCGELLSAWTYFRSVYPALASHLFVLSSPSRSSLAELRSHSQLAQHTNEVAQSVSKLLDEAERILRSDRPAKTATWLSRAATNPAYARIIHHHLQQQRQQYQHQQPTRPTTEVSPSGDGHVYGRLLHYPHQLEQGNSAATSRTLDKLRQLSGQQHLNHQSTSADSEFSPSSQEDEQLESNKIPVIAGDGESHWINGEQSRGSWKNRARNDADSLRKKFVYGNVIYKPPTASPSEKEGETQQLYHRQNPIETLRQLTATASNNGENENDKHLGVTSSSSNYKQQSVSANKHPSVKANSESYGRILVSPARSSSNLATSAVSVNGAAASSFKGEESSSQGPNNNEQQKQLQPETALPAAQAPQWPPKSTLDKLRQQLALNEPQSNPNAGPINIFPVDGHLLMDNSELVIQQEVGTQAAIGSEQQEQSDSELLAYPGTSNDENEFEGVWHSGPIQQVEVRQLRTENIDGQPRQLLITRTTADPRDAFLVE